MDVLAIILACSLHHDDALVRALVEVQSQGNVYFVGDLATLKTKDSLASAEEALRFAEELRRHGGRPAVGLLGIPLDWAGRYERSPIELFDACTNVAVATAAFAEYQDRCAAQHSHGRPSMHKRPARPRRRVVARATLRVCVLSLFARDLGLQSAPAAILRRVLDAGTAAAAPAEDAPPRQSLIFGPDFEEGAAVSATRGTLPLFLDAPTQTSGAR